MGGTLRTVATGLPQSALAFSVLGTTQIQLPLQSVGLPAPPNCALLVQPLVVQASAAEVGRATFAFDLPNAPSLSGVFLQNQVLSFAFDSSGALESVAATQGFSLVIGSLW